MKNQTLYNKCLEIIDLYEKFIDESCTCFQGNPPCSKCENCPMEGDYDNAIKFVEDYERYQ